MKTIQIAIDGPASSGKSTVAKIIAKDFGFTYLDTGAMYRAATYMALRNQLGVEQVEELLALLDQHPISFGRSETGEQLVFVGDVDITHPIRENEVTNHVSAIAAIPEVREKLVSLQQEIAQQGGIVMDGRDIGTVVLPQAELKIFLVASVDERAERRYKENIAKGIETDLETLKEEIAGGVAVGAAVFFGDGVLGRDTMVGIVTLGVRGGCDSHSRGCTGLTVRSTVGGLEGGSCAGPSRLSLRSAVGSAIVRCRGESALGTAGSGGGVLVIHGVSLFGCRRAPMRDGTLRMPPATWVSIGSLSFIIRLRKLKRRGGGTISTL